MLLLMLLPLEKRSNMLTKKLKFKLRKKSIKLHLKMKVKKPKKARTKKINNRKFKRKQRR